MQRAPEFDEATTLDLRDRVAILEERLERGWEPAGRSDAAFAKWHGLLGELEAVEDELRRRRVQR